MKRKISYLLGALMLVFCLAGCSEQNKVSYQEEAVTYACEQMFEMISSDAITVEQIVALSDWQQGYLMAQIESQTGIQISADNFMTAIQAWKASEDECGTYIEHGEYRIEAKTTGLVVSTEAVFSERTANLEFAFDEDLEMESFTINANFSMGEILSKAGLNTLLGMGTVFAMLIFMSFVISLFKYIPILLEKKDRHVESTSHEKDDKKEIRNESTEIEDTELVAVIAAAIAAYEGTTTDGFVVRSIKRRNSNKWNV